MIFDTNVISEVWRAAPDPRVAGRVAAAGPQARLSVVVLGELRHGIDRRPPDRRRDALAAAYRSLVDAKREAVLPISLEVAEAWGALSARLAAGGRAIAAADGLIAATALVHDLELWTRNTRDFAGTGVRLFDPWEG